VQRDTRVVQQAADRGAGGVAEDSERLILGRDQAQLYLGELVRSAFSRGNQRQVIQGEGPACPGRLDERQLVDPPLAQLVEQ
jgi:hypothetical protein